MLKVCHLYPDLLNLYGDRGNVIAFYRRCQWRGIEVKVEEVNLGDQVDFSSYDFLFMGGGSDREQNLLASDLGEQVENLKTAIEDNLVVLAICGGYQLLGKYYLMPDGTRVPGLGILDYYTEAGNKRLIGNIAVNLQMGDKEVYITGFENHGGKTFLGSVEPLGKVMSGNGNNGTDGHEGARYKNVFCSYLHGPLLPKNAAITDYMISQALKRRNKNFFLNDLDDTFEKRANSVMLERLL
ncbi:MAG: glutamine amidotransferase [Clostridiales bacterium]|nr:glutamine amidotransferase [Clostridiales bacterium]MCF8022126.1 glutamine amidotransferase [Clostridiales bacterium]